MSSIKDEIIITFEELKLLQVDDIAACVDKYQALTICEKSSAPAEEIYNIWVHKLFKGFDVSQFEEEDWLQIFGYLERILDKFIVEVSALVNDTKLEKFNSWWLDTLELLIWLESVVVHMDVRILALVLNFILEVVIKSCNKTDKRSIEPIAAIQKKLLHFSTTHMINMNVRNIHEFNGVNKVLSSLCDVGSTISSANIKLSIETWRVVATITTKCNGYYKSMDTKERDSFNDKKIDWTSKPIIGILSDLKKLFKYLDEDSVALNNEKFLKVGQFLLKLLNIIMQNSVLPFPGLKEFFEVYALCMHQLKKKNAKKVTDYIQNDLNSILHAIYKQQGVVENICLHLRNDNKSFETCDLALDYMQLYLGNDEKQTTDVVTTIQIFDLLFADPLYFIDNDKYPKVLLYFVNLTAEDATGDLHVKWCNNVVDQSWIKAFASCEILGIYYSNLSKRRPEQMISCLEYWISCWQKFNVTASTSSACQHKYLIERLLKILVTCTQLPHNKVEHVFYKYPNSKILLLKCGHGNGQLFSYFNTNIRNYLQQLQNLNIKRKEYTDLLNLMDILCKDPRLIKIFTAHDDLVKAFLKIFLLSATDMQKFKDFFNKSFHIFTLMKHDDAILKTLKINLDKTKSIAGIFLLAYLFKLKPDSDNLLECLQTTELMEKQNFLLNEENNAMDLKLLKDLYSNSINANTNDVVTHTSKRPRLVYDDCDSSNYKSILNDMLELSRQLLNCPVIFDFTDLELIESIEHNLLKCSQK